MTDDYELRNMIEAEQEEFVDFLHVLTPEQWAEPSLCKGWSVREAVLHITIHAHTGSTQRVTEVFKPAFNREREAEWLQRRSTDEGVDWLGSPATAGGHQDILTQLSEFVIHQQDVRRPLGIDRKIPAERLAVVLDFGISVIGVTFLMAFSRRRAKGLRLVAPDIGWWAGSGPEVRGPGEAILMALNGRGHALSDLEGDGVPVLAGRIKP